MAENKTQPTKAKVADFLAGIDDSQKKKDCQIIAKIMREATGKRAVMWGDSIVGFGQYHYKYASGLEGDFMVTGYSPRKQNLVIYIMPGFKKYSALLKKLGKHKHSSSCLYIKRLSDADEKVLAQLVSRSVKDMCRMYETNIKQDKG